MTIADTVRVYHYTTPAALLEMRDARQSEWQGLVPRRSLITHYACDEGIPAEARNRASFALLEPEPENWKNNPEFPGLWWYLLHDIVGLHETALISFDVTRQDEVFVVDRAHAERHLYSADKGNGIDAWLRYWNSRTPLFDYQGGFAVPEVILWNPVAYNRLRLEAVKSSDALIEEAIRLRPAA